MNHHSLHPGSEQGISPRHSGGSASCTHPRRGAPECFGPSLLSPGESDCLIGSRFKSWLTDNQYQPIHLTGWCYRIDALSGDNGCETAVSSRTFQATMHVAFLPARPFRLQSELTEQGILLEQR